jgi:predicted ester cyclase
MNMNTNRWTQVGVLAVALLGAAGAQAKKEATGDKGPNRRVFERWFELVDSHQTDRFGEVEAADLDMKTPMGATKGSEAHVQMTKMFAAAFPNFKHTVGDCVESGERIACEGKFAGDHTGPMAMPGGPTIPATGKHVQFDWQGMARIKDGKVVSVHVSFDNLGFMQQLGLVPPPPSHAEARK